jgi:hypothetical protein
VGRLATLNTQLSTFLRRHPLVRDALVWAIPALIIGAVLRGMLLSYLPYAYWGSDSRSYYGFTEQLLDTGKISLYDKRRYLYLIGMLPVTLLPGSTLRWLAWIQHLGGLATLVPLAYCVRKAFVGWKAWVVPVTVAYAGLPLLIWYEHELLAECLFFHAVVWMLAGWLAFAPSRGPAVIRNFWWFFAGFATVVLTKPAGLFLWPYGLLRPRVRRRVAHPSPHALDRTGRAAGAAIHHRPGYPGCMAALHVRLSAHESRVAEARRIQS